MSMIWCVEDDPAIRDIELYALRSGGFESLGFEDADSCREALRHAIPRLILLDVMLPGTDGMEFLRWLRSREAYAHIPVIMATAKGSEFDRIAGLDLGADDYLSKPFGMMEMLSRVKAVLRRYNPPRTCDRYKVGHLELDTRSRIVTVHGERVSLTLKEFDLLRVLISNPNTAYSRDSLYALVWESDFIGETRTVDMHIRTLRQKLGLCGEMILTVRGVGYLLEDPHEA